MTKQQQPATLTEQSEPTNDTEGHATSLRAATDPAGIPKPEIRAGYVTLRELCDKFAAHLRPIAEPPPKDAPIEMLQAYYATEYYPKCAIRITIAQEELTSLIKAASEGGKKNPVIVGHDDVRPISPGSFSVVGDLSECRLSIDDAVKYFSERSGLKKKELRQLFQQQAEQLEQPTIADQPKSGDPTVARSNITRHKIRTNSLDVPIDKAIKSAGCLDASAVFLQLRELALNGEIPFTGVIEKDALCYTNDNNEPAKLSKAALRQRLKTGSK